MGVVFSVVDILLKVFFASMLLLSSAHIIHFTFINTIYFKLIPNFHIKTNSRQQCDSKLFSPT